MMPSGYRIQEMFNALKLHFGPGDYNYLMYHGKTKNVVETPMASLLASRFRTEEDALKFFVYNFASFYQKDDHFHNHLRFYVDPIAFHVAKEVQTTIDSRTYLIKDFLKTFYIGEGSFSVIKQLETVSDYYYQKKIPIVLLAVIMKSLNLYDVWKSDDPLLKDLYHFTNKLSAFFPAESKKIVAAMQDVLKSATI